MSDADNYSANLTWLASEAPSISRLCAEIGINRQQFNKYISGKHLPSRRNLARIAKHFVVSEKDMFLPPAKFMANYQGINRAMMEAASKASMLHVHAGTILSQAHSAEKYVGIYYRYQVSSIYRNTVIRSLLNIYKKDRFVYYYYIEKFKNLDNPSSTAFSFRYHGICSYLDGKLFLIDSEFLQKNEMTFAVLTPIAREPQRMMFGIAAGVAASVFREPFATKMALVYYGEGPIRPSHLRRVSNLEISDLSVPEEVRIYLGITRGEKGFVLRGN